MPNNRTSPLVSLCMATCARPDLFEESFQGLLSQTWAPLEIIVLADGSHPDSIAILRRSTDHRLRCITTPRPSGMVRAWNFVCGEARGKYFLFCADDDVLCENAIDQQVRLLEEHPEVVFCHADFDFIDDEGRQIGRWVSHRGRFVDPPSKAWPEYLVRTRCCMQTVLVRREAWCAVEGWDEDAGNPGDNSLYLKLLRIGSVGHVPHTACRYRIRTARPDTWEKRFRNTREYHALAVKHLAEPPAGLSCSISSITRQVLNRLVRDGVALRMSAPDERSRVELCDWLDLHVWRHTAFGCTCRFLNRLHALGLVSASHAVNRMCRQSAKQIIIRTMRRNAV